ncbi:DUF308 domain-containing protein [Limosilactobacillus sp. RRLNB_1_1]|uniref:DUF308 domain-containing protein n=1 Tax=Limosilactobacillus albertensis TaxID=2759752 RepID=A0A7W3TQX9_9LACO|nr:DUF308 domain-containing protein [Limosilactobacillus albertensis]MBB1069262.1 DUF308 domain-containing protein [Limosilactobacillus albertensis]MCD7118440.1 DUF308 domain-containing protein [Limosilactobacillus albertensis]MCD7128583.1 DUF308 domain-containing protein [Limosilactobacillus albertensis]
MIFLVIMGALFLILGGFYLANSWQQYREWKSGTIIVVLSIIAIVYGAINLPYFHHNNSTATNQSSSSSRVAQSNSFSSFSNGFALGNSSANEAQQENKTMAVLRQMQKGYSKLGTVDYNEDSKTFQITPTDDNTVEALKALAQDPSQAEQMGWPNLTKSIKSNSGQVSKALGDGYSISIMNPGDSSKALYTAKDGKTTYDIADQN